MKLKDQLVNLELSQKMKELGFKQDSLFYWVKVWDLNLYKWRLFQGDKEDNVNEHISAFTVAEILEKLPPVYCLIRVDNGFTVGNTDGTEERGFVIDPVGVGVDKNPANVVAKMLIYLKVNKLIK